MSLEGPRQQGASSAEKERQEELLRIVIEVAGDNEKMIGAGISKALRNIRDTARYIYLQNVLSKGAKKEIRRARKKYLTTAYSNRTSLS